MSENNIHESAPLLEVKDLAVEYMSEGQTVHAVNGVSFTVEHGKTLGLVGETGAGKTSIAKAILRILPKLQTKIPAGEIYLDGENILEIDEKSMQKIRGNKVAMIFQDPMTALNPIMRVGKQIAETIKLHEGCSKKEANERAMAILKTVGIQEERFRDYPHQFSGGMKQRVVIAMALACHPELLLADEPTTALDVTIQAQVLDLINDLKEKEHTAMILITHDLGVVAKTCDDVAVIYAGQIVEYGTKEEVFLEPSHPYTKGLFGSLPDIHNDTKRLSPILGARPDPTDLPDGCYFGPRCPYADESCRGCQVDNVSLGGSHICRCLKAGKEDQHV